MPLPLPCLGLEVPTPELEWNGYWLYRKHQARQEVPRYSTTLNGSVFSWYLPSRQSLIFIRHWVSPYRGSITKATVDGEESRNPQYSGNEEMRRSNPWYLGPRLQKRWTRMWSQVPEPAQQQREMHPAPGSLDTRVGSSMDGGIELELVSAHWMDMVSQSQDDA